MTTVTATCWTLHDIVACIARLPAQGTLLLRTVVVPNPRLAQTLRRGLLEAGRRDLLAGTHFLPAGVLAAEVLLAAEVAYEKYEEALRPARLRLLFEGNALHPQYFEPELLRTTRGWDQAFAKTIGDLERAGLAPENLAALDVPAARGLGAVWETLNASAGDSWSAARVLLEAAARLESDRGLWPVDGAVLAIATTRTDGAEARFIRAIPRAQLALCAGRPLREAYLERVGRLFGAEAATVLPETPAPRVGSTDRKVMAAVLFEPAEVQVDPDRLRAGAEPDGSLALEAYSGVEAEIEAAASWVAREIYEHGTPLKEIAVLMPAFDPYAQLVCERIQRLPHDSKPIQIYVAGGLPATGLAGGACILTVIRTLAGYLSADALADVIPILRVADGQQPVPKGRALDLAYALGTPGGSPADPRGALAWPQRFALRETAIAAQLAAIDEAVDEVEEQAGLARGRHKLETMLGDLRAVHPAVEVLVDIAARFLNESPLVEGWSALRDFLEAHVRLPVDGVPIQALLHEHLERVSTDPACRQIAGESALELITLTLKSLRVSTGHFGDPAVYVGTVRGAAGLEFTAVRVIGLIEGAVPAQPREDPVLPDVLRRQLAATAPLETAAYEALASMHDLDQIVRHTTARIALSAPFMGPDRSYRELSSLFLEAVAALDRPVSMGEDNSLDARMHREVIRGREAPHAFRFAHPIGEVAWEDCAASPIPAVPPAWRARSMLDLDRIAALCQPVAPGAMDGLLGADTSAPPPGLTPAHPISASQLQSLLECPHRFLFERLVGWKEPTTTSSLTELDSVAYGALFHRTAQCFYNQYGPELLGKRDLDDDLRRQAEAIARQEFEASLEQYPLVGKTIRDRQLNRLTREFVDFLDHECLHARGRFVASEKPFGSPEPVRLETPMGILYARGFIDLIHVIGDVTHVRDLKTGRCHPRNGDDFAPHPVYDAQIGLYAVVTRLLATRWSVPERVAAAYVHSNDCNGRERAFIEDFEELHAHAWRWLGIAAGLLKAQAFPRTPDPADCGYCPFQPVCGPEAQPRATEVLAATAGDACLAPFAEIKH